MPRLVAPRYTPSQRPAALSKRHIPEREEHNMSDLEITDGTEVAETSETSTEAVETETATEEAAPAE